MSDEVIAHMSPAHFDPINPYGTQTIELAAILRRGRRRPRRKIKLVNSPPEPSWSR